jgi:hypothetical protein
MWQTRLLPFGQCREIDALVRVHGSVGWCALLGLPVTVDMRRLEVVFAQLPEDYRQVITLARIVGLSHAEIAGEMGRNEGTVRVLLHRALVRLGWLLHQERLRERE